MSNRKLDRWNFGSSWNLEEESYDYWSTGEFSDNVGKLTLTVVTTRLQRDVHWEGIVVGSILLLCPARNWYKRSRGNGDEAAPDTTRQKCTSVGQVALIVI